MGVKFSNEKQNNIADIIMSYDDVKRLTNSYFAHQFQPISDVSSLRSLFLAAFGHDRISSHELNCALNLSFQVFRKQNM